MPIGLFFEVPITDSDSILLGTPIDRETPLELEPFVVDSWDPFLCWLFDCRFIGGSSWLFFDQCSWKNWNTFFKFDSLSLVYCECSRFLLWNHPSFMTRNLLCTTCLWKMKFVYLLRVNRWTVHLWFTKECLVVCVHFIQSFGFCHFLATQKFKLKKAVVWPYILVFHIEFIWLKPFSKYFMWCEDKWEAWFIYHSSEKLLTILIIKERLGVIIIIKDSWRFERRQHDCYSWKALALSIWRSAKGEPKMGKEQLTGKSKDLNVIYTLSESPLNSWTTMQ